LEEQEEARNQYFSQVIAPQVDPVDVDRVKSLFDADTRLSQPAAQTPAPQLAEPVAFASTPGGAATGRALPPRRQAQEQRPVFLPESQEKDLPESARKFNKAARLNAAAEAMPSSLSSESKDLGLSLLQGTMDVASLPVAIYEMAGGQKDSAIRGFFRSGQQAAEDLKSDKAKAKQAATAAAIDAAETWQEALAVGIVEGFSDPSATAQTLARMLPQIGAGGGAGRLVEAGFKGLTNAARALPVAAAMTGRAGGIAESAASAVGAVQSAASKVAASSVGRFIPSSAVAGAVGSAAIMQGDSVGEEVYKALTETPIPTNLWAESDPGFAPVYEKLLETPVEKIQNDPFFIKQREIQAGLPIQEQDPEEAAKKAWAGQEAKRIRASDIATSVARKAAGISIFTNALPGGSAIETALLRRPSAQQAVRSLPERITRGGIKEGLISEPTEEGGGAYVGAQGKQQGGLIADPIMEAAAAAGQTVAPAMIAGGGAAAISRPSVPRSVQPPVDDFGYGAGVSPTVPVSVDPTLFSNPSGPGASGSGAGSTINFTPADSPTAQAGLVPIVVPTPTEAPLVNEQDLRSPNVSAPDVPSTVAGPSGEGTGLIGRASVGATGLASDVTGGWGSGLPTSVGAVAPAAAPDATAPVQRTAGLTSPLTRASDQDLLARATQAQASKENNNANTAPVEQWFGRRGDGYATEADARQALPGRKRMFPDLEWSVEEMPSGKFRIAGYASDPTPQPLAATEQSSPSEAKTEPVAQTTQIPTSEAETRPIAQTTQIPTSEAETRPIAQTTKIPTSEAETRPVAQTLTERQAPALSSVTGRTYINEPQSRPTADTVTFTSASEMGAAKLSVMQDLDTNFDRQDLDNGNVVFTRKVESRPAPEIETGPVVDPQQTALPETEPPALAEVTGRTFINDPEVRPIVDTVTFRSASEMGAAKVSVMQDLDTNFDRQDLDNGNVVFTRKPTTVDGTTQRGQGARNAAGQQAQQPTQEQEPLAEEQQPPQARPVTVWAGRSGEGYSTPTEARVGLNVLQKREPDLLWAVEQMPSGNYQLTGYEPVKAAEPATAPGATTAVTAPSTAPALAEPSLRPAVQTATEFIGAVDSGTVTLDPQQINSIARNLGLEISNEARPEDTIGRIRSAVTSATPVEPVDVPAPAATTAPILAPSGYPFKTQQTASVYAQQNGITDYSTIKVDGGWAIEPTETNLGAQTSQAVQDQSQGQAQGQAASGKQPDLTDELARTQPGLRESEIARLGDIRGADQARLAAQQILDGYARQSGQPVPTLGAPDAEAETMISVMGRLFGDATGIGQRVFAYSDPGGDNGFSIRGAAFVNTAFDRDSVDAPRTALHELRHVAEQMAKAGNKPAQQFTQQLDSIFDDMTDEGRRAYIENFLHKDELAGISDAPQRAARLQQLIAAPKTRSEMVADFLGNRAQDREFLTDLATADPQGFEGFVKRWLAVIDNLIAKLRGGPTQGSKESAKVDQYVRDLNKAKIIARDALIAFRKGNLAAQQGQRAQQSQAAPAMSRREAERVGDFDVRTMKDGTTVVYGDPDAIRAQIPDDVKGRVTKDGVVFTTAAAARVKAALGGRSTAYSREGAVLDKLPMRNGKYLGAPAKFDTPGELRFSRRQQDSDPAEAGQAVGAERPTDKLEDRAGLARLPYQGYEKAEVPRVQAARKLAGLIQKFDEGKLTPAGFELQVRLLSERMSDVVAAKDANKIVRERQRGADLVREKLIAARRRGDVDFDTAEFALWVLQQNPSVADNLGISVRERPEGSNASGDYNPAAEVMRIFKGVSNSGTAVHEILHHTERMMPPEVQAGIRREWAKQYAKALVNATGATRAALEKIPEAMVGGQSAKNVVSQAFADGVLDVDEHYQLTNPSEFWAVNATSIMRGRYDAGSWIAKAKQWLGEMLEKMKGLLGARSNAAVLKGVRAVMDGDGKRLSKTMLVDLAGFDSVTTRETVDDGAPMFSRRQVPDAIIGNKLGALSEDRDYASAKAGNVEAAFRLARRMVTDQMVEAVRALDNPILVGVVSVEAAGRNLLPLAAAARLAALAGSEVDVEIVQADSPKRTGMSGLERILNRPTFEGKVQPGRNYVLVDDTITQGGTFAAMADHITSNGGSVGALIALTGKGYSAKIVVDERAIEAVYVKFEGVEDAFRKATGYGFDELTASEARYLANYEPAAAIRDRITAAAEQVRLAETAGTGRRQESLTAGDVQADVLAPGARSSDGAQTGADAGGIDPDDLDAQFSRRQSSRPLQGQRFSLPAMTRTDAARRALQDDALRMRRVIEAVKSQGGTVDESQNFYNALTLMPGRVQALMTDFQRDVVDPMIEKAAKADISFDELALYAYAMHAKERNAYIASINPRMPDGGSGMTDADANQILADIAAGGKQADYDDLHADLMAITATTRQVMLQEGLITQDEFDAMDGAYEHYIPLRGFAGQDEDTGRPMRGTGTGINIRGNETTRALGRRSRAGDLIENVIRDYAVTVQRAEKNNVGKVLLDFVLSNPDPDLWDVNVEKRKPRFDKARGVVTYTKAVEKGENTIGVKVGGDTVYIELQDQDLTRALRQAWKEETGEVERLVTAVSGWFNTLLRNTLTRYNPAFALINTIRDAGWSGLTAALGELGVRGTGKYLAVYNKALMASGRYEMNKSGSASNVFGNPAMDRLFDEFRHAGGITGGWYSKSLEDISADIRDGLLEAGAAPQTIGEKIKYNPVTKMPWRAARATLRGLELMGAVSENATRFALYVAARDMGKTPSEAGLLAKNGTTNFNRKGEWGGALNNAYLFFNAAMQGGRQFMYVMKKPQVQALMAGVAGIGALLAMYGAAAGGEDEDGEAYWDKIPGYEKSRNLIIMLPPGDALASGIERVGQRGRYFKIPVQYGFNIFPNLGYMVADVARHTKDPKRGKSVGKASLHMTGVLFESLNPFGGSFNAADPVQWLLAVSPTITDLPIQLVNERSGFGDPSAPERASWDVRPDSERMFTSQMDTVPQKIAKALNEAGGGNEAKPGSILGIETSVTPGTIKTLISSTTGGLGIFVEQMMTSIAAMTGEDKPDLKASNIPFLNKLYGEVDEGANMRLAGERMREVKASVTQLKNQMRLGLDVEIGDQEARMLALAKAQEMYERAMTDMRKNEIAVIKSDMTEAEKRLVRKQIRTERDKLASTVNGVYLEVFGEKK
jgi:hypoxanthine-guanine phosphoribosyltransferase